jgi:hypothetical protein
MSKQRSNIAFPMLVIFGIVLLPAATVFSTATDRNWLVWLFGGTLVLAITSIVLYRRQRQTKKTSEPSH